jgi:hypothetical protein
VRFPIHTTKRNVPNAARRRQSRVIPNLTRRDTRTRKQRQSQIGAIIQKRIKKTSLLCCHLLPSSPKAIKWMAKQSRHQPWLDSLRIGREAASCLASMKFVC